MNGLCQLIRIDTILRGSVANFDFRGKIRKIGISNSMTYRPPNARKSKFATEPAVEGLTPAEQFYALAA
jgi:hypothetical protein